MTESEARAAVAGVGLVICSIIAALAWGQTALNYVMVAWMLWLTWDRSNLHEHAQMRWRRTIRALAALRKRHDDELTDLRIIVMSPHLPNFGPDEPAEKPDEMPTGPIEIAPATVPDGMPLAVHTALIEQRPSPVPRDGEWVERTVNIGGTLQTYRIPAKREEAS